MALFPVTPPHIMAPAWLLAGLSWFLDRVSSRAAAVASVTAIIAATIMVSMTILTQYVIPHVAMPAIVYQVLSVVAPADWAAQVGVILGVKSISMAHYATVAMLKAVGRR